MPVKLFSPLEQRSLTLRNRIVVSPMCMYSSEDGFPNDWHLVHLGSLAVGGAAVVIQEATAVEPRGRISYEDAGIYYDAHVEPYARITRFVRRHGAIPGIQLAHAGRKASTHRPWEAGEYYGDDPRAWRVVAPSPLPYDAEHGDPEPLSEAAIARLVGAFAEAARRALEAGYELIELHGAHGYLIHEFLSPLANRRDDRYGGRFENRIRFLREIVAAVRKVWPERFPLWVRLSATDWAPGGWDVDQTVALARILKDEGVDLLDASSAGLTPKQQVQAGPGYQVPFAARIRKEAGLAAGAVGLITTPQQAEAILQDGAADVVLLGRALLRDPHWPLHAARALGVDVAWPVQYERAKPRRR